jgi:hypothetical protein
MTFYQAHCRIRARFLAYAILYCAAVFWGVYSLVRALVMLGVG